MVGLVEHAEIQREHAGDETEEGSPGPAGDGQRSFGEDGQQEGHAQEVDPIRTESSPPADAGLPGRPQAGFITPAFP
jgi:hypothetical protein